MIVFPLHIRTLSLCFFTVLIHIEFSLILLILLLTVIIVSHSLNSRSCVHLMYYGVLSVLVTASSMHPHLPSAMSPVFYVDLFLFLPSPSSILNSPPSVPMCVVFCVCVFYLVYGLRYGVSYGNTQNPSLLNMKPLITFCPPDRVTSPYATACLLLLITLPCADSCLLCLCTDPLLSPPPD